MGGSRPLEVGFQLPEFVVGKNPHRRPAGTSAIDEAGMGEFVEDHDISPSHEGGYGSGGGRDAGGEDQRGFRPLGRGKFLLEGEMLRRGAADQA